MAQIGFYPDPPSRRLGFDADGTRVFWTNDSGSTISEAGTTQKAALNSEANSTYWQIGNNTGKYLVFIFPQKINLTHFYCKVERTYVWADPAGGVIEWSNDTNTAYDGNWNRIAGSFSINEGGDEGAVGFRTQLNALPINDIKAIRFRMTSNYAGNGTPLNLYTWHLWGHKSAGEAPDRVDFCDIDGSEFVTDVDYGDQPRNTTRIWQPSNTLNQGSALYLRNRSLTKVANDVSVLFQTNTGPMQSLLALSKDNASFGTQISYPIIQPQQIVGPVYVREITGATTTLGMHAARLKLSVGNWT